MAKATPTPTPTPTVQVTDEVIGEGTGEALQEVGAIVELVNGERVLSSAPQSPALIKARVLCAGVHGQPDDVVEVTEAQAAAAPDLDSHPDAVAYAESLAA